MTIEKIDNVVPGDKWHFDADVADVFDDMLSRSIPQYEIMRKAVVDLAALHRRRRMWIVDLGCSRGEAIAPLLDRFGADNHYIGIDVSEPMLEAARSRFHTWIDQGVVEIQKMDLRERFPHVYSCVTLSVLTLQFVPIEYRMTVIQRVYDSLLPGGAFILVEKILGANAELDKDFVRLYYDLKSSNGYSQEQIERKRLSLEGVLVPVTARMNQEMLMEAGFRQVDCFWRWMNFAGWIAIK
jgi:tRNA (cmo5U34)-methyltransferase